MAKDGMPSFEPRSSSVAAAQPPRTHSPFQPHPSGSLASNRVIKHGRAHRLLSDLCLPVAEAVGGNALHFAGDGLGVGG